MMRLAWKGFLQWLEAKHGEDVQQETINVMGWTYTMMFLRKNVDSAAEYNMLSHI